MNNSRRFAVWFLIALLLSFAIALVSAVVISSFFHASTADSIAELQLLFTIITLPALGIGFAITIDEFRKSHAVPKLVLFWSLSADSPSSPVKRVHTFAIPNDPNTGHTTNCQLHLFVENVGDLIATLYRIKFDLSYDLITHAKANFIQQLGRRETWCWTRVGTTTHVFKSNNEYNLYPGDFLLVATLAIPASIESLQPKNYNIVASITTDKTPEELYFQRIRFASDVSQSSSTMA